MSTLGYLFIIVALFVIRGVTKGRSIAELPGDLADVFTAIVAGDNAAINKVMQRVGDPVTTKAATVADTVTPGTSGQSAFGAEPAGLGKVKNHVRQAATILANKAGIKTVGGWRAFSAYDMGGHPAGLAVDFPCTPAQGKIVSDAAIAGASDLAVKYVMWQSHIWYPGKGWVPVSDRGSASANHEDHVHVSFNAAPSGKLTDAPASNASAGSGASNSGGGGW